MEIEEVGKFPFKFENSEQSWKNSEGILFYPKLESVVESIHTVLLESSIWTEKISWKVPIAVGHIFHFATSFLTFNFPTLKIPILDFFNLICQLCPASPDKPLFCPWIPDFNNENWLFNWPDFVSILGDKLPFNSRSAQIIIEK